MAGMQLTRVATVKSLAYLIVPEDEGHGGDAVHEGCHGKELGIPRQRAWNTRYTRYTRFTRYLVPGIPGSPHLENTSGTPLAYH